MLPFIIYCLSSECGNAFWKAKSQIQEVKSSEYTETSSQQEVELIRTSTPINITVSVSTKEVTSSPPSAVLDWEELWPNISSNSPQLLSHVPEDAGGCHGEAQDTGGHQCFPVLPLTHIKHASDFMDTLLIQVRGI